MTKAEFIQASRDLFNKAKDDLDKAPTKQHEMAIMAAFNNMYQDLLEEAAECGLLIEIAEELEVR